MFEALCLVVEAPKFPKRVPCFEGSRPRLARPLASSLPISCFSCSGREKSGLMDSPPVTLPASLVTFRAIKSPAPRVVLISLSTFEATKSPKLDQDFSILTQKEVISSRTEKIVRRVDELKESLSCQGLVKRSSKREMEEGCGVVRFFFLFVSPAPVPAPPVVDPMVPVEPVEPVVFLLSLLPWVLNSALCDLAPATATKAGGVRGGSGCAEGQECAQCVGRNPTAGVSQSSHTSHSVVRFAPMDGAIRVGRSEGCI
ncbi:hypothetical protein B484DRAFT_455798 [Ochromonadaceae sp. CCMP2298]|nr:hypothetical protein B484DRAFT_455798 [Ochromonadaceae sp. CCMP2298]